MLSIRYYLPQRLGSCPHEPKCRKINMVRGDTNQGIVGISLFPYGMAVQLPLLKGQHRSTGSLAAMSK